MTAAAARRRTLHDAEHDLARAEERVNFLRQSLRDAAAAMYAEIDPIHVLHFTEQRRACIDRLIAAAARAREASTQ